MKRMFIAEDSGLRDQLHDLYCRDYEVVTAADEYEGRLLLDEAVVPFDVAIFDVIMPVENEGNGNEDKAGIRLLKHSLEVEACRSALLLTVRWDVEDEVNAIADGHIPFRFLLKDKLDQIILHRLISELIQEIPGQSK